VAFANIVRGVPIDADKEFVGTFFDLLNPYALLGGLVTLSLFVTHGAVFLVAQDRLGDVRDRARALAGGSGWWPPCWPWCSSGGPSRSATRPNTAPGSSCWPCSPPSLLVGLAPAGPAVRAGPSSAPRHDRHGRRVAVRQLFPEVMPSSIDPAYSLTTTNAASTPYTLRS
jgi:cytochrome bd ubiquinol oxidase subunit II